MMIKTRILLIVMLALVGFSGKGQKHLNCGYPIHVKADSLFNYVFSHSNNKGSDLRDIYDYSIGNKLDSVYGICQDYMINKLGKDIYCGYVTLQFEGFKTSKRGCYGFSFNWIEYSLELPGLPGKGSIGKTNISFIFAVEPNKPTLICSKTDIPDCKFFFKKGFKISKDKALEIVKNKDFIHNGDNYNIQLEGFNWIVTKILDGLHSQIININILNGELSAIQDRQAVRID